MANTVNISVRKETLQKLKEMAATGQSLNGVITDLINYKVNGSKTFKPVVFVEELDTPVVPAADNKEVKGV